MKTRLTSGEGWSLSSDQPEPAKKTVNPASPKPQIRIEKRNGKAVTVIAGLHTYGAERLEKIARELKALCGAGGTVKDGKIEIQGDKLAQTKLWFEKQKQK